MHNPLSSEREAESTPNCGPLWALGNRHAGRGHGRDFPQRLERIFQGQGLSATFFWPDSKAELCRLAAAAASAGTSRLAVIGGDGTLVDVVNETWTAGVEIGLIPAGDANDIAAAAGVPRDLAEAVGLLACWHTLATDLVRVRSADGRERIYAGAGGIGLDAEAARLAAGPFCRLPGIWRYVAGAIAAFAQLRPFELSLDGDDSHYRGPALLAVVANTPAYGGGIRIAPAARMDDGWLEVVLLENLNWGQVISALPSLLRSGELRGLPLRRYRARRVRLSTDRPVSFHGDGEPLGATPLEIEVLPRQLRLVCAPPA